MACRPYNTGRCLLLRLFNCPNFGVHFIRSFTIPIKGKDNSHFGNILFPAWEQNIPTLGIKSEA